jgi:hypothetical protein
MNDLHFGYITKLTPKKQTKKKKKTNKLAMMTTVNSKFPGVRKI